MIQNPAIRRKGPEWDFRDFMRRHRHEGIPVAERSGSSSIASGCVENRMQDIETPVQRVETCPGDIETTMQRMEA